MARLNAKLGFRRAGGLAAIVLCVSAFAAAAPGSASATPPAEAQYHIATPPPPRPGGESAGGNGGAGEASERPARAVLDSLSEPAVLLVLGCLVVAAALAVAIGRRQATPARLGLGVAVAGLVLSLGLLIALPGGAEPSPSLPRIFWGVVPQAPPPESDFRLMRSGGVDSIRITVPWATVEPAPRRYDFSSIDPLVGRVAQSGIDVLATIGGTPSFVSPDGRTLPVRTPRQRKAWTRFLRVLVARYGPHGGFWTSPAVRAAGVPYRPIREWQIWNEPNFFYFAVPRSPRAYGDLVKLAHRAITGIDPDAKIVLAGLFARPKEGPPLAYQATDFLRGLYRVPGIKGDFDAVALHPYEADAADVGRDVTALRAVMQRSGDTHTPLWITELGWGSGHGTKVELGPEGQADELTKAFDLITRNQQAWRIERVYWFSWDDLAGTCNFCDSTGLIARSGKPKPAWQRYEAFAHRDG